MGKYVGWIILVVGILVMYQLGLFDNWIHFIKNAGQDEVIYNDDGSYTTVNYKTIFQLPFKK